ncbi:putative carboxymethylenebutenolidase [Methylocella tundrae]|uniref:Putative carboxymethylenebutenolidase n=1 Tax=Methylocella tundrae TaxID=227605 RepID=A0A8B6MA92_METTU|nr:dienelactone hydrolase family protein [Methylocella tundrae]VTZ51435.1 putative carboxymethylenebutenolidase [Methylocella tundrae]
MPADAKMSDIAGLTLPLPVSRRAFMATSTAAAAGYTLATGPVRADVIKTSAEGLIAGAAAVKASDGEMPLYFARPEGVANPPIILVAMEVFGLHEFIKDVVRQLGKLGAFAVAPDYYFRKGDLTQITNFAQLMPLVNSKPDQELFADLDATVAWAKAQGGDESRLGIIGFCRGGRTVWLYSTHNPALKAGVSFYGSLMDPPNAFMPKNAFDLAGDVKAPVLGLYGAEDQGISPEQVRQMESRLKDAGKTAEFRIYPGAPHGFFADYRESYRQEAAKDAWRRATAWFKKYGVLD